MHLIKNTRSRIALLVGLLGIALAVGGGTLAQPAKAATVGGPLTSLGKCADSADLSSADGNPVIVWDCNRGSNQAWSFPGDGTARTLGKCLTVVGGGTGNGTLTEIRTCNGSPSQSWSSVNGNLVNTASGKCLDIPRADPTNGNRLIIWTCGDHKPNQVWGQPVGSTQSLSFAGQAADDPAAVQASPGTGLRQELFVNAKDLTNPFTSSNPQVTNPAGQVDIAATIKRNNEKYGAGTRVAQLYFYVWDYAKSDIPASALANMQNVLDTMRSLGYKTVLRFAIDDAIRPRQCYTVQDLQRIIAQTKNLIAANTDVITLFQSGLVGAWGEWGPNCTNPQNTPSSVNAILTAQMQSLPAGMPFAVRYPWHKSQVTDPALRARIGYHNDYFVIASGFSDYYMPSSPYWSEVVASAPNVSVDGEMPYDKYESADPYAWSTQVDALAAARRLQTMHYSTLSNMHNSTVTLPAWKQTNFTRSQLSQAGLPAEAAYFTKADGTATGRSALDYIRDHLGFRLRLTRATIGSTSATTSVPVSATLVNDGFAAPRTEAPVRLAVLDSNNKVVREKTTDVDWRTWQGLAGSEISTNATQPTHKLDDTVDLSGLPAGTYRIALHIPTGTGTAFDVRFSNSATSSPWVTANNQGSNVLGTITI
ncbi:DUF4832 domain-containing protein [Streptomyces gardneri]|uniref:DUF4832 domain-containing protein n=1 Tax=Streptomyces gardneri TaxID=66892 RepID=UPI0036A21FD3